MNLLGILFLLLCCTSLEAQQDRHIELSKGNLINLPIEYQPAKFSIEKQIFIVGMAKVKNFKKCIIKYLPTDKPYDLQFSASWKEGRELPPHINIRVVAKGNRYFTHSLTFNLDNLELIKVFTLTQGNFTQPKLTNECKQT